VIERLSYQNIIREIGFFAQSGEMIGVIGPNGAGKSALLKCLCGVFAPVTGEASIDGASIFAMKSQYRARNIAYVAQNQTAIPEMKISDMIQLGRLPYGRDPRFLTAEDQEICQIATALCGLHGYEDRYYHQISGGEKSRVNLARALAVNAPILLADEPLTGLDVKYQIKIMEILRASARNGKIVLAVIHDLALALRYCDRIIAIKDGTLRANLVPREIVSQKIADQLFDTEFYITEHPVYGYSVQF
jgi:iron complex transport system ATP-binding protein